jgi:hypothetical protein
MRRSKTMSIERLTVFVSALLVVAMITTDRRHAHADDASAAADMQAIVQAGQAGEQHAWLTGEAGTWDGLNRSWLAPDAPPIETHSVTTVTPIMGGRFVRVEVVGEMPGMDAYRGEGLFGYDNTAEQYVATWIDNLSTAIRHGTGEPSDDGQSIAWTFDYHCPIVDAPTSFRQVETRTGRGEKTLEMFGVDPRTGKEHRMMKSELTLRQSSDTRQQEPQP